MTLRPFGSVSSTKSIRSSGLAPPWIVLLFAACAPAVPAATHNRETATKRSLIQTSNDLVPGGWTGAAGRGQARYEGGQAGERLFPLMGGSVAVHPQLRLRIEDFAASGLTAIYDRGLSED